MLRAASAWDWCNRVMAGRTSAGTALVAVAVALLAAGCTESAQPLDDPRLQVRELLSDRARALSAGDTEAYLQPVVGDARETEERIAEGVQTVGLDLFKLTLTSAEVDRQAGAVRNAEIDVVYRYEGVPENNQLRADLRAEFEQRDGEWVMTASEFYGQDVPAPAWGSGPVEAHRSEHFLFLYRPGLEDPDELVAHAEEAYERLVPELTLELEPLYVAMLAGGRHEFLEMTPPFDSGEVSPALAMHEFSSAGMVQQVRAQNRRMVVNTGELFRGQDADASTQADDGHHGGLMEAREVFQHELGHLVLYPFTFPHTPDWVVEAGAMYLAEERREEAWAAGLASGIFEQQVRSFEELYRAGRDRNLDAWDYAYANAGALYLTEQADVETFWEFYRSFDDPESTDQAGRLLDHLYGFDAVELDQRTMEWMREAVEVGT